MKSLRQTKEERLLQTGLREVGSGKSTGGVLEKGKSTFSFRTVGQ